MRRGLPAAHRVDEPGSVGPNPHPGLHPTAAQIVGVELQFTVAIANALQEIANAELVVVAVVDFRSPAGPRIVERQRADDEQEAEGAPFDDFRPIILGDLVVVEGDVEAQPKLAFVGARCNHLLDNTNRDQDTRPQQGLGCCTVVTHGNLVASRTSQLRY